MNIILYPKTIFIVEGNADLSQSLKCLLECHNRVVRIFKECDDFMAANAHSARDIVLLNFERFNPGGFDLLHRLLFSENRPDIVITSDEQSVFQRDDKFLGDRVTILFHPFAPADLVSTIEQISLQ